MTLIIGDIHGCYDELQTLLDKAGMADNEDIIALGDLVDRGPDSKAVLDFFMTHDNAKSIRGNHEQEHILLAQGKIGSLSHLVQTKQQIGDNYDSYLHYMKQLPVYIEIDEAILVHAFYDPRTSLAEQRDDVLLGLDSALAYLQDSLETAWFLGYEADKPIIVGHKDYTQLQLPFIMHGKFYGLDTRCVMGGALTGLKLPEWQLYRVPAKRDYDSDSY